MRKDAGNTRKKGWSGLKAGDLLALPCSDERALLGQILIPGITFYMRVLDIDVDTYSNSNEALSLASTILIGETTDAELVRGVWKPIGNASPPTEFSRPFHVVNSPEGLVLRTFERNVVRPASADDFNRYGYEVSVSPTVFSGAARCFCQHGLSADFGRIDARRVSYRSFLD